MKIVSPTYFDNSLSLYNFHEIIGYWSDDVFLNSPEDYKYDV